MDTDLLFKSKYSQSAKHRDDLETENKRLTEYCNEMHLEKHEVSEKLRKANLTVKKLTKKLKDQEIAILEFEGKCHHADWDKTKIERENRSLRTENELLELKIKGLTTNETGFNSTLSEISRKRKKREELEAQWKNRTVEPELTDQKEPSVEPSVVYEKLRTMDVDGTPEK